MHWLFSKQLAVCKQEQNLQCARIPRCWTEQGKKSHYAADQCPLCPFSQSPLFIVGGTQFLGTCPKKTRPIMSFFGSFEDMSFTFGQYYSQRKISYRSFKWYTQKTCYTSFHNHKIQLLCIFSPLGIIKNKQKGLKISNPIVRMMILFVLQLKKSSQFYFGCISPPVKHSLP